VPLFKNDPNHKSKKQNDININDSISLMYDLGLAFLLSSHFQSLMEMGVSTTSQAMA
jgi:hypothetical protein